MLFVCNRQVQFILRNENTLKIKETFFFVFTVHRVSLTRAEPPGAVCKRTFRVIPRARARPRAPQPPALSRLCSARASVTKAFESERARERVVGGLPNDVITLAEAGGSPLASPASSESHSVCVHLCSSGAHISVSSIKPKASEAGATYDLSQTEVSICFMISSNMPPCRYRALFNMKSTFFRF